ncbi:MAG: tetratricopeptide repeat protein, partial [Ignavibacteriales bacterium]|nr:tetratricopeptide repeat protein [Ignavibacteriales bacterium]
MKTKLKIMTVIFFTYLCCSSFNTFAQGWTKTDSLEFEKIKDDTTELRKWTNDIGSKKSIKAHGRLGFIKFKEKNYKDAEKEFRILEKYAKKEKEGKDALYFIGRIESFKDNIPNAKKYYEDYLIEDPNGEWAQGANYYLILQKRKLKDTDVLQEMDKFLKKYPNEFYTPHVKFNKVEHFIINNQYDKAIEVSLDIIENYPETNYAKELQYQIGDFYVKQGKYEEAKNYYDKLIKQKNKNTEPSAISQYLLGETYEQQGNFKKARNEYKKAKDENPSIENWKILSDYSIALSFYNEWLTTQDTTCLDSAKVLLTSFTTNYPTDKRTPRAMLTIADIYYSFG